MGALTSCPKFLRHFCSYHPVTSVTIIDIYTVDTVPPVHIVWYHEATAKSTTQDGGMAETYICGRKLRLMHLHRSVDVSTWRISRLITKQTGFNRENSICVG